jgi:TetR/AcrR family transcriptional repressor of lmrAB and yxaGH operons
MKPDPNAMVQDTRSRILQAALRLFRKHGYSGVGINQILEAAEAPKGSLYHHFPKGKEEIGVAVIDEITRGLMGVFEASRAPTTALLLERFCTQLARVMQKTSNEICALFAGFVAEGRNAPLMAEAVARSYREMGAFLKARLEADGWSSAEAQDMALVVVALLEGGALLSQARQDQAAFLLVSKEAVRLVASGPRS